MEPRGIPRGAALKIGLLCDWYLPRRGGIEFHLHDLALQLRQQGHHVDVITPTSGDTDIDGVTVRRIRVPLFPFHRFIWTPRAFRQLLPVLRRGEYDVIHCHVSYISPFAYGGAYLCQKLRFPTVVTFHSFLGIFSNVLSKINHLIHWSEWPVVFSAVSRKLAADIRAFGVKKVATAPNGVDLAHWRCPARALDKNRIQIVSVMRLCIRKRPDALIKIIAGLRDQIPSHISVKVKIVGEGYMRGVVEWLIRRFKLEETVEMLGYQSRSVIQEVFEHSDIFVLPSILESFGISALEARCAGLPVVAMNQGGIGEFIENGRSGFLVGSDREMLQRLVQLVCDADLRLNMNRYNQENPPIISWTGVVAHHLNLYKAAISKIKLQTPS
ncbi:glycosyltransferase family 4 protein [Thermodesulfobacteriota bacterium]